MALRSLVRRFILLMKSFLLCAYWPSRTLAPIILNSSHQQCSAPSLLTFNSPLDLWSLARRELLTVALPLHYYRDKPLSCYYSHFFLPNTECTNNIFRDMFTALRVQCLVPRDDESVDEPNAFHSTVDFVFLLLTSALLMQASHCSRFVVGSSRWCYTPVYELLPQRMRMQICFLTLPYFFNYQL